MLRMHGRGRTARAAVALGLLGVGAVASAFPPFLGRLKETYPIPAGSALDRAKCQACHAQASGGPRNPFGKALEAKLEASGASGLTKQIFESLQNDDADGDGASNKSEIEAGNLPGDPKDKPATAAPTTGTTGTTAAAPEPGGDLVPKHSMHPIIVHFPIGLFLFGAFLEFFGIRGRNDALRQAAFWNMAAGALTGLASVATGVVAALRLSYELLKPGTPVFNHLICGSLAAGLMLGIAAWRRRQAPVTSAYFAALALTVALVVVAGHFGGALVYG